MAHIITLEVEISDEDYAALETLYTPEQITSALRSSAESDAAHTADDIRHGWSE